MPIVRIEQQIGGKKFDAYGPYSDRAANKGFSDTINGRKVLVSDFQFMDQPSKVELHWPGHSEWVPKPVLLDPTFLNPRRFVIPVSYLKAQEVNDALQKLRNHPSHLARFESYELFKEVFESAEKELGLTSRRIPLWERILNFAPLNIWE